jgi:hypothetical protein
MLPLAKAFSMTRRFYQLHVYALKQFAYSVASIGHLPKVNGK